MWWLPLVGLVIGLIVGAALSLTIPAEYSRYTAMAILACLDSVLGAVRAELDREFNGAIFASGFLINIILAGALTFLGNRLGVELYIAVMVVFGIRMFDNLARIRRQLLKRMGLIERTQGTTSD